MNYRVYELQSHAWALLPWFIVFFLITIYTIEYRAALVVLLSNILVMTYCTYYGDTFQGFLHLKFQLLINQLYPTFLIAIVLFYKRVVELTKEAEVELFQKRDVISKMIITLSHEINNPLTIAKLTTNKLKRDMNHESLKRIDESLDRISKITHLIKDVNDLKEIEYGEGRMYDLYNAIRHKKRSIDDIF